MQPQSSLTCTADLGRSAIGKTMFRRVCSGKRLLKNIQTDTTVSAERKAVIIAGLPLKIDNFF